MELLVGAVIVVYLLIALITVIALLKDNSKEKDSPLFIVLVGLLWFIALPLGFKISGKMFGQDTYTFNLYREAGFDSLVVRNGKWIAGFRVSDIDRGSDLILVIPGYSAAPEDIQDTLAHPFITAKGAIVSSHERHRLWKAFDARTNEKKELVN